MNDGPCVVISGGDAASQVAELLGSALCGTDYRVIPLDGATHPSKTSALFVVEVDEEGSLSLGTRRWIRAGGGASFADSPTVAMLTVVTSACMNSSAALRPSAIAASAKFWKAVGGSEKELCSVVDVGVDTDVEDAVASFARKFLAAAGTRTRPSGDPPRADDAVKRSCEQPAGPDADASSGSLGCRGGSTSTVSSGRLSLRLASGGVGGLLCVLCMLLGMRLARGR